MLGAVGNKSSESGNTLLAVRPIVGDMLCPEAPVRCQAPRIANDGRIKCIRIGTIKWSLMTVAAREANNSAPSPDTARTTAQNKRADKRGETVQGVICSHGGVLGGWN